MDKKELCNLRGRTLRFDDFEEFNKKVKSFFDANLEFSVVVGNKDFNPENWDIKKLSPRENSDRLTVENYFEGLRQIEEGIKDPIGFKGTMFFEGVNSFHYSYKNSNIFWAAIGLKNSSRYFFNLYYSQENKTGRRGYAATSCKEKDTEFDRIVSKFLGPNKEYKS